MRRPSARFVLVLALVPLVGRCGGAGAKAPQDDALVRIVTVALPSATSGVPYEAAVEATGPNPPLSFRLVAGRLPDGLSFDGGTGAVSGIPRADGRFRFRIEVRDGADPRAARDVTFASDSRTF